IHDQPAGSQAAEVIGLPSADRGGTVRGGAHVSSVAEKSANGRAAVTVIRSQRTKAGRRDRWVLRLFFWAIRCVDRAYLRGGHPTPHASATGRECRQRPRPGEPRRESAHLITRARRREHPKDRSDRFWAEA